MQPGATTDYEYDVFISYSHHDRSWVRSELLPRLETAGLKVCIDFRDFRLGAPSVTEMERAATTSRKTVLILSPEYLASDWTAFENIMLQTLDPVNRTLRVIPVLRSKVNLPPRIGSMTYIDFVAPDDADFAWTRLLDALGGPISPSRRLHVFLCHEQADQPSVHALYNRLRNDGFEPWMHDVNVLPGQDAEQEIQGAVHGADVIIVCLSTASIDKAGNLSHSIEFVLNKADQQPNSGIYFIPLKLEKCGSPNRLHRLKPVNLFETGGYEQLVRALRHVASREKQKQESRFLTPPNFSWGGGIETPWFVLTDDSLLVQAASGQTQTYHFAELIGVTPSMDNDEFELGGVKVTVHRDAFVSPDQEILVLFVGTGLASFMPRMDSDAQWDGGRLIMLIFAKGSIEPRLATTNEWYVHGGPAFSQDGKTIAFAYSHNWRPYDSGDPLNPYIQWDDTLAVVNTQTWQYRDILTLPSGAGYGRWAEPKQFEGLTFVSNNVLFAHDWTYRGDYSQAWNIPIDGSEPMMVENPFLKA